MAWHSLGHLTVARIARLHLESMDRGVSVINFVESRLLPLSPMCGEKDYPFTESATWPDKIQYQKWVSMFNWHFSDQPYFRGSYSPAKNPQPNPEDVAWAILDSINYLESNSEDPLGKSSTILGKSITLRNLIHFVGDIHQPLHTSSMFDATHQNGDQGGNLFLIKHYRNDTWNNLHFVWDHLFDIRDEIQSPLTAEQYESLTVFAMQIKGQFEGDNDFEVQATTNSTPESWLAEGLQIVEDFVYTGLVEGEPLPESYILKGREIVLRRLALAGKRLALLLESIYMKHQYPKILMTN